MLIEQFYREDLAALREDLAGLEKTLRAAKQSEWEGTLEGNSELRELLTRFDSRMMNDLKRPGRILDDVEANASAEGLSPFGLLLAATAQGLQNVAQSLEAALVEMENPPSHEAHLGNVNLLLRWVRGQVLPVVSRIIGSVWKILINILPLRSWKVKGEIGAAFQGLAEGELVIDFGESG